MRLAWTATARTRRSRSTSFTSPLAPVIRGSQNGVAGISATDGTTVLNPSVNQYENCLRCHGTSSGQTILAGIWISADPGGSGADPLNIDSAADPTSTSSHPVMHDRSSALAQPSLLSYMLNLDGRTQGRAMGVRILCTDCHNSDDNREFGGTGPNGPHGSQFLHLLERRYEFSQVAPGSGSGNHHHESVPQSDSGSSGEWPLLDVREMPRSHPTGCEYQLQPACAPHQ